MATIFTSCGYRVVVYPNDHGPAHVHAVGDGWAKIALGKTPDDVALIETAGISVAELRRIVANVIDRHGDCLRIWRNYHGD